MENIFSVINPVGFSGFVTTRTITFFINLNIKHTLEH